MREEWRTIPSFPNYQASSEGRIRRVSGQAWTVGEELKPRLERGYLRLGLFRDAKAYRRGVHVLVCEAFHGPKPSGKHHAAHRNGVKTLNHSFNLRWALPKENEEDKIAHGTAGLGEKCHFAILTRENVAEIRALRAVNMVGRRRVRNGFYEEMAARFGVKPSAIKSAAIARNWKWL